jgi:iron complex transport system substrate-binding protein
VIRTARRRRRTMVATALLVVVAAAGCGDDDEGAPATGSSGSSASVESSADAGGTGETAEPDPDPEVAASAFPVVVEHAFGETTVDAAPERVVLVGLTDQDVVLSLGVVPVAVREFFGGQPSATWPWAHDLLDGAEPEVLPNAALNFEQIAALDPDLILGLYAGLTQDEYATLSAIAPTVAQSADHPAWAAPWQEQVRIARLALGREEAAAQVVADTEQAFADAAAQHPEFAELTAVVAWDFRDGNVGIYSPEDPRSRFVASLGFTFPEAIAELDYGGSFTYLISTEQLGLIEADAVIFIDNTTAEQLSVLDSDVFDALPAVTEGRVVVLPRTAILTGAFGFNTPLAIPAALDGLLPRLAAAIDGDPATPVEPAE